MNTDTLLSSLDLPAECRVDQRVPKKLLLEHGAPTAADKRRITEGMEELYWLAALKPATVGVPEYRDEVREYLEIAVLTVDVRRNARAGRLIELIHRAVPYPVFLIAAHGERLLLSLAHKRWSQGEAGATVLDGELVTVDLSAGDNEELGQAFLASLALARQPRTHLLALYQGWMDRLAALQAARVTGAYGIPASPEQAAARLEALGDYARLEAEIARLRAAAAKEKQLARQVELNLELKRLERQCAAARQRL